MKLSKHAFTTFWDVHAWGGVVTALVLHVMFFFGVFALFQEELGSWQEGTAPGAAHGPPPSLDRVLAPVLAPPDVGARQIGVHRIDKAGPLRVGYRLAGEADRWKEVQVDRVTGAASEPRSELGGFLYGLHFLWHDAVPWLYYVAGVFSVGLLLAIVTGVLIHLKDLVRQLDQFRPRAKVRVLWSDLHKVLGVFGLPFQLLFAFTGVLLCLTPFLVRPFVGTLLTKPAEAEAFFGWGAPESSGPDESAKTFGFDEALARAATLVPGARVTDVTLLERGRARGQARISYEVEGVFHGDGRLFLSLVDGRALAHRRPGGAGEGPTGAIVRWLYGLHYAKLGGIALRFLYAFLALATCFVLLSGNWIWLARRRPSRGNELLARLTLAVGGGVVAATVAMFWANRLLPWHLVDRANWEQRVFFGAWLVLGAGLLARPAARSTWTRLLVASGAALAAVPILSTLTASAHAFNVGRHGHWGIVGVEATLLVAGALLALVGWVVARAAADRAASSKVEDLTSPTLLPQAHG